MKSSVSILNIYLCVFEMFTKGSVSFIVVEKLRREEESK